MTKRESAHIDKGNIRIPKLLELARGAPCLFWFRDVCNGNPSTTVAAHSNRQSAGKGMGIKSHDCNIAFACSACHDEYDGRTNITKLSREDKEIMFDIAHQRTMEYLWRNNLIRVA